MRYKFHIDICELNIFMKIIVGSLVKRKNFNFQSEQRYLSPVTFSKLAFDSQIVSLMLFRELNFHTKRRVSLKYLKIYVDTDLKIIILAYQNNYVGCSQAGC